MVAYGFIGKIAKINLTTKKVMIKELVEDFFKNWLGGYGLGCRILYNDVPPHVNPLAPENVLGFTTGLLTGTKVPACSSFIVVGKSPLTETWGDSRCGGSLGPELKKAGFDAIFIYGKSDKPSYILINDGDIEIKDASHLWGKDTAETEDILREDYGDKGLQIASIGQAGENLALISGIVHDKGRIAARSGLGALMGSKRLKAIAVRGTREIPVYDYDEVKRLTKEWYQRNKQIASFRDFLKYGTCAAVDVLAQLGDSPCKNWKGYAGVDFPNAEKLARDYVMRYNKQKYGCWACPIRCGAILELRNEFNVIAHKPEYETLAALGTLCLNDNLESIIYLNDLCNRYGIDTISLGGILAFLMECYEMGILTKENIDGLDMSWGNAESMIELTKKIAFKEGFGGLVADGVKRAAERIGKGSEKYAMHVGGQELPMHDPKFAPGLATTYVCDATPGRHTQAWEWMEGIPYRVPGVEMPIIGQYHPPADSLERAIAHAIAQKHFHAINSLGVCQVPVWFPDNAPRYEVFVNAVTGWSITIFDLLRCGERIASIRQAFNVREGFRPKDFTLPGRVIGKPPLEYGPLKGITIDVEVQSRKYFEVMKWDYETGKPSKEHLIELGLEDIANDLYHQG